MGFDIQGVRRSSGQAAPWPWNLGSGGDGRAAGARNVNNALEPWRSYAL